MSEINVTLPEDEKSLPICGFVAQLEVALNCYPGGTVLTLSLPRSH